MGLTKRVKKWGDSLVIILTKEDIDLYGLVEGDIIEFPEMLIQKKNREKIKDRKK